MMDQIDSVAALVLLNGGEIVGKTRLQKMAYLLDAKGLGLGFDFDYHNYGPFSAELAIAADDAISLKLLSQEERVGFHEVPYTVFHNTDDTPAFPVDSQTEQRRQALGVMRQFDALILELAATAVYLDKNGYAGRAWDEVKKRKPLKATDDRIAKAKALLGELGLVAA